MRDTGEGGNDEAATFPMQYRHSEDTAMPVTRGDSEALLAEAAARAIVPMAGLFGPDSASWKINREAALFLGAGRAALLQLAHPWVTAALAEHSSLQARPIARFHNTFRVVFAMVFGSLEQALKAARSLYALHERIQGEMPESVAAYGRGSHYRANETGALRWVYATLVESAVMAFECALGPLAAAEREAFYAETKTLAALFGLSASALPADWGAFCEYVQATVASDVLGVSEMARSMAQNLLAGAGSWIRPPEWYRALTALWLPERLREEFELRLGEDDRRTAERALRRIPRLYRRLPPAIRFIGPWHEAQARLASRREGWVTGLSSRFWIGQARLPFGDG